MTSHLTPALSVCHSSQYYNDIEAKKYAVKSVAPHPPRPSCPFLSLSLTPLSVAPCSSRMMDIQTRMSERALELLSLPPSSPPLHLLDIGCGSGLSGEALTEAGHYWTGVDISPAMLGVALSREVEGDLLCHDIGQGLPFRPSSFDHALSVSVLQWLCNADHSAHVPRLRLHAFFQSLFQCLRRGGRAVFQLYPETAAQLTLIMEAATRCGFSGGVVVDFPNSAKAKKYFLCLSTGAAAALPKALDGEGADSAVDEERRTVAFSRVREARGKGKGRRGEKGRASVKSREWIVSKKERQRRQGKVVMADSKYTGRKRKPRF